MAEQPTKTLMAILAHPDDESFGMGGTLALYARRGVQVHLVCATRGEAGEVDAQYLDGYPSIAERREAELRCAAGILGLAGVHLLGYRDSGMPGSPDNQHPLALINQPLEKVAEQAASCIRRFKPQVVVTFDPVGGYKHPDHIFVHQATVAAFKLAGQASFVDGQPTYQPAKLYYHLFPKNFLKFAVRVLPLLGRDPRRFGKNGDIDLAALVESGDFPIHARIQCRQVAREKEAAAACHASQLEGASLRSGPVRWVRYLYGQTDCYMRAYPPAEPRLRETDLFTGI